MAVAFSCLLLHHDRRDPTQPPSARKERNDNQPTTMAGEEALISIMRWRRSAAKDNTGNGARRGTRWHRSHCSPFAANAARRGRKWRAIATKL